jgi:AcrR family transcriptional regulator
MTRQYPIRTQRKAENRERLIVAAQELFELKGYEATTLEGVAERAGVHTQTL